MNYLSSQFPFLVLTVPLFSFPLLALPLSSKHTLTGSLVCPSPPSFSLPLLSVSKLFTLIFIQRGFMEYGITPGFRHLFLFVLNFAVILKKI